MSKLYCYPQSTVSKCRQTSQRHSAVDQYLTTWRWGFWNGKVCYLVKGILSPLLCSKDCLPWGWAGGWVVSWLGD